jgi:branched-chain amino acid transport system ATP-binding protein
MSRHLQLDSVTAGYRGAAVLESISLDVSKGEAVGVFGRNGAGKTTLLRTISGFLKPRAGRVLIDGRPIGGLAPFAIVRHGIGHVPEGRRVIPGMTVLDNLKLGGFVLSSRELPGALAHVHDMFPRLAVWSRRSAASLSGGEQQLLAIGRAMMSRPDVLMLDEPLTGLAPVMQSVVLQALRRIGETGVGLLLVEQNVHQSLRLVHRGVVLERGQIVLNGTAAQLRADPRVQEGYLGAAGPEADVPANQSDQFQDHHHQARVPCA